MITSDTCHHEEGNTTLGGPLKFLESSYSAPEKKYLLCPYKVVWEAASFEWLSEKQRLL